MHIEHCIVNVHTHNASRLHICQVTLFVGELGGFFLVHILTRTSAYNQADITPAHTSIKQLIPLLHCGISSFFSYHYFTDNTDISIIQLVTDKRRNRNSCYLFYILLLSVSNLIRTLCSRE